MEGFNDITFGLYVRNGVLLETGENVGISYGSVFNERGIHRK